MEFNELIAELRASSENLPNESADRSLLSSVYCNKACKAIDKVAENQEYDNVITGLWLIVAHFAEQLRYLKPVPALSELCFKLFRQCAKSVLNIQWQNLEEDSSVRQNFLISLANLHAKLIPFDFPRFRLLEALTESPWTNPTLAKVMGGEIEDADKEEVRSYIEQEDPIILQLRVDMMLKENCEEYALNLCNSCLTHPELQTDLSIRKIQLSLLYKLGHEDKLQEECQKLSIHDALRIIKQLQTSEPHRQLCTVLAQTFMVQNWIRPSDMEANKELLRLWIRQQLLVDIEQDRFKDSVWAMAKLSQSTEQIVIFIDVLREECGDTYLQLYVDMCIFAINVDKGQMETNIKENNLVAAVARRGDMASVCAKLSCLCHHASLKVARICALSSFALKPSEQSFTKIGTFYGQGGGCCKKCGIEKNHEPGKINPATLYEVERLLNMLRPEYLNPDNPYGNIQALCRRFLHESLKNAEQRKQQESVASVLSANQTDGLKRLPPNKPTNLFEALLPQDVQNTQLLLNRMRLQNIPTLHSPPQIQTSQMASPNRPNILVHHAGAAKQQYVFDAEKIKSSLPYGVPLEQQHQYFLNKHEKELEQRRKNSQKKKDIKAQEFLAINPQYHQQNMGQVNQTNCKKPAAQSPQQITAAQVSQLIQSALQQDSGALQKLTQTASPEVVRAVLDIMKSNSLKTAPALQQSRSVQLTGPPQQMSQPLPTVSTLLKPAGQLQQQQPEQKREQPPPRRYPRPQLYAQPIIVSTAPNVVSSSPRPQIANTSVTSTKNFNVISTMTPGQKQKAESLIQSKNQAESIRQFMQLQMSNQQQKQISEMRQMSGSTITVNNIPTSSSSVNLIPRAKTTVELAEEAALAKQQGKALAFQQNQSQGYISHSNQHLNKTAQPQVAANTLQINSLQSQSQKQQNQQNNLGFSLNSFNTSSSVTLPSSDELSGSIVGIDDTIIKELLQDSGILANTFPDIEVDNVGEDKSRKISELTLSSLPQNVSLPAFDSTRRVYTVTASSDSLISNVNLLKQSLPISSHPPLRTNQLENYVNTTQPSNVYSQHSVSAPKNQILASSSDLLLATSKVSIQYAGSTVALNNGSQVRLQIPSNQQSFTDGQLSIQPRENINLLVSVKQEDIKPTMDQLREQMKKEHIEGEIYMDSANNATYRCIICSLAFETLDNLREHVRNVCKPGLQSSSVYNTKIKQDRANSAKAGLETTTVFQCLRCFELCVSDAGIKQHRLTCKRVPTVPSDLKKETPNRNKVTNKSGKTTPKREMRDNSYVVPEMPLPFPYPSLNTEAVFKSLAIAGKSTVTSFNNSEPKTPAPTFPSKPQITITHSPGIPVTSLSNISTSTSGLLSSQPSHLANASKSQSSISMSVYSPGVSSITSSLVTAVASSSSSLINVSSSRTLNVNLSAAPVSSTGMPYVNNTNTTSFCSPSDVLINDSVRNTDTQHVFITSCQRTVASNTNTVSSAQSIAYSTSCSNLPDFNNAFSSANITSLNQVQNVCSFPSQLQKDNLLSISQPASAVAPDSQKQKETPPVLPKKVRKRQPKKLPAPSFTEISGSGGSKFFKCNLCSQTLCSLESFVVHWDECATKNKALLRRRASRDKLLNAKPLTDEMVKNLKDVIATVAAGGGASEEVHFDEGDLSETELLLLEDPCDEENNKPDPSHPGIISESDPEELNSLVSRRSDEVNFSEATTEKDSEEDVRFRNRRRSCDSKNEDTSSKNAQLKKRERSSSKICSDSVDRREEIDETEGEKTPSSASEVESEGSSLLCKVCKTTYQNKRMLLQHFAGKHLKPYTVKSATDSTSYICHLCQKTFPIFMHYMQHVPDHSVTIYEKMRTYVARRRIGHKNCKLISKKNIVKKNSSNMVKALKSKRAAKKSALDKLKRELLSSNTEEVREKLSLSKKKRSKGFTSSEDDYSSDISKNFEAHSENVSEGLTNVTIQNLALRRGRGRPRKQESTDETSSERSSSKLSSNKDEDFIMSDDTDSDYTEPPTTRSKKGNVFKRIKQSSESEGLSDGANVLRHSKHSKRMKKSPEVSGFESDSSSVTLTFLKHSNGSLQVVSDVACTNQNKTNTEANVDIHEESAHTITVCSLSRQQMEKLKYCDLNPTIVLKNLTPEDIKNSTDNIKNKSSIQTDNHPIMLTTDSSLEKANTPKSSSFFDSYLSYLNCYPKTTDEIALEHSAPRSNSSVDSNTASSEIGCAVDTDGSTISYGTSTDKEDSLDMSNTSLNSGHSKSAEVKTILAKYPTRRCSVNLGKKVDQNKPTQSSVANISQEDLAKISGVTKPQVFLHRINLADSVLKQDSVAVRETETTQAIKKSNDELFIHPDSSSKPSLSEENLADEGDSFSVQSSVFLSVENVDAPDVISISSKETLVDSCSSPLSKGGDDDQIMLVEKSISVSSIDSGLEQGEYNKDFPKIAIDNDKKDRLIIEVSSESGDNESEECYIIKESNDPEMEEIERSTDEPSVMLEESKKDEFFTVLTVKESKQGTAAVISDDLNTSQIICWQKSSQNLQQDKVLGEDDFNSSKITDNQDILEPSVNDKHQGMSSSFQNSLTSEIKKVSENITQQGIIVGDTNASTSVQKSESLQEVAPTASNSKLSEVLFVKEPSVNISLQEAQTVDNSNTTDLLLVQESSVNINLQVEAPNVNISNASGINIQESPENDSQKEKMSLVDSLDTLETPSVQVYRSQDEKELSGKDSEHYFPTDMHSVKTNINETNAISVGSRCSERLSLHLAMTNSQFESSVFNVSEDSSVKNLQSNQNVLDEPKNPDSNSILESNPLDDSQSCQAKILQPFEMAEEKEEKALEIIKNSENNETKGSCCHVVNNLKEQLVKGVENLTDEKIFHDELLLKVDSAKVIVETELGIDSIEIVDNSLDINHLESNLEQQASVNHCEDMASQQNLPLPEAVSCETGFNSELCHVETLCSVEQKNVVLPGHTESSSVQNSELQAPQHEPTTAVFDSVENIHEVSKCPLDSPINQIPSSTHTIEQTDTSAVIENVNAALTKSNNKPRRKSKSHVRDPRYSLAAFIAKRLLSSTDHDDASTSDAESSSEGEDAVYMVKKAEVSALVLKKTLPQEDLPVLNTDLTHKLAKVNQDEELIENVKTNDILSTNVCTGLLVKESTDKISPKDVVSTDSASATPVEEPAYDSIPNDMLSTENANATLVRELTDETIPNDILSTDTAKPEMTDILSTDPSSATPVRELTDISSANDILSMNSAIVAPFNELTEILSENPTGANGEIVDETNPKERRPSLGIVDYSSSEENSDNDDANEQTDTADVFQTLSSSEKNPVGGDIEKNEIEKSDSDMIMNKINHIVSCEQEIKDTLGQDTTVSPPVASCEQETRDSFGQDTTVSPPVASCEQETKNSLGQDTSVSPPVASCEQETRDSFGQDTTVSPPVASCEQETKNNLGQDTSVSPPVASCEQETKNSLGQDTTVSPPVASCEQETRDSFGQDTTVSPPVASCEQETKDSFGQDTTVSPPVASCEQETKDSLGQDTSVSVIREYINSSHINTQGINTGNVSDVKAPVEDQYVPVDQISSRNNRSSDILQNCEDTMVDVLKPIGNDSHLNINSVKETNEETKREIDTNCEIKVDCRLDSLNEVAQAEVYTYPYVDEVKLLSPFYFNSQGSECQDKIKKHQVSPIEEETFQQKLLSLENMTSSNVDLEDSVTTDPVSSTLISAAESASNISSFKKISEDKMNAEKTNYSVKITDEPSTLVLNAGITSLETVSDEVVLVIESCTDPEITVCNSLDHCCEPLCTLASVDHKKINTSNEQTCTESAEVKDTNSVAGEQDFKTDSDNSNVCDDKCEVSIEKEKLIDLGERVNESRPNSETEQCRQKTENDNPGKSSRNIFSDFKSDLLIEEDKKETEHIDKRTECKNPPVLENDDADDLSDFDLVIEEDKSSRNIVPYKAAAEKQAHTSKSSFKASDSKSPGAKISRKESARSLANALSSSKEQFKKEEKLTRDLIPRKPLSGARSLKKASQEQFVWDMDEEEDGKHHHKNFISKNERTKTSSAANEAFKRKKNALREKSESSPFTWDLDDGCNEKSSHINQENKVTLSVSESQDDRTRTKSRRIIRKKRNLSPDFVSGTFISSKSKSFSKSQAKKEKKVDIKGDGLLLMNSESPLVMLESSGNSITVDEEISFKRDSFSSPFLSTDSCSASSSLTSSPSSNWRRRRRSQKLSQDLSPSSSHSIVKHLKTNLEQALPKSLLALRIRHSSLDSNKSESSQVLKRHGEATTYSPTTKKVKKSCDPLKAGLIKITPPPVTQGTQDGLAPLTRSSDAAVKALNQKNLRNRGVNPSEVSTLSSSKTLSPSINNVKDSVRGGKYFNMSTRFSSVKSSPSTKTAKMLNNSPPTEKAVVKRRNPSAPPIPSRKPRLKTGTMAKGNGSVTTSTAVFMVDPVPPTQRSGLKSTLTNSTAGTKTIHTQLPPGASLKSQSISKLPKIRIDKSIKQERIKKQRKKT